MRRAGSGVALVAMVVASGGAGLTWELLWQHHASLAIGVSALGAAIVLSCTMAGMAAGALAAGAWLKGRAGPLPPLRLFALLEAVVGLAGLGLGPGFAALARIDRVVWAHAPSLAPLAQAAGIALLVGPAAAAMGATVPVFRRLAARSGTSLARLYAWNTAGAAVGVLGAAFVLLPSLGVALTGSFTAALDLAIALCARLLADGEMPDPATAHPEPRPMPRASEGLPASLARALVVATGFATFVLEVAWFRSLEAAFQSTTDSFAVMLAAMLVPLALGARLGARLPSRRALAFVVAAAGALALLATPLVERFDTFDVWRGGYAAMELRRLAMALLALGPSVAALGAALPFCLDRAGSEREAAVLYALNTAGAVAGALAAGWLLLPSLGAVRSAWLAASVLLGAALVLQRSKRARATTALASAAALAVASLAGSGAGRTRVQGAPGMRVLAVAEGPDATVSVVEERGGARHLFIDGFETTGEARAAHYMAWMGRLPMLMHPDPKRALVICFGTGQTANAVRREGPVRLDVVELSRAVLAMAPRFASNEGVLDDPRTRAIVMDGRAWLRRGGERYDVITLEPMSPQFAGTNALYSDGFYALARARLNPGGTIAQWLPLHILPPGDAAAIARTFVEAFPDAALWLDPVDGTGILLGRKEGGAPLADRFPGLARARPGRDLPPERVRRIALDAGGLRRWAAFGALVTDDDQLLAYGPGRREASRFGDHAKLRELNLAIVDRLARPAATAIDLQPPP